jgi:hypothetical protein
MEIAVARPARPAPMISTLMLHTNRSNGKETLRYDKYLFNGE